MVESNILEMRQVCKHFPGVQALDSVDFCVRTGEIHALVGHNGAGKSTLLKILSGIYRPDSGEIVFEGNKINTWSPKEALDHGISLIYQELNLVQDMTVAQNIFLGREKQNAARLIQNKPMREQAKKALANIGELDIDVNLPLKRISIAQQQMVAIAKALDEKPRLLILDEPTSRLSQVEITKLFDLLRNLSTLDISIIYVSHRIEEIYKISDRVTVLRDGKLIGTHSIDEIQPDDLIHEMIGERVRKVENAVPPSNGSPICLEVKELKGPKVNGVSFKLQKGEVLGIVGAVGSGKTELIKLMFGLEKAVDGEINIYNEKINLTSSAKAVNGGIALCPEDRKNQGLVLDDTIARNISLVSLKGFSKGGWFVQRQQELIHAQKIKASLNIMTPSVKQFARYLSGGNQQKVVLGKWLSTDSKVFIFDEPTVGVDVQGKNEIYSLLKDIAEKGSGVIFVTSDPEEGWSVCSRLLVMFEGKITADVDPKQVSLHRLMSFVMGGV